MKNKNSGRTSSPIWNRKALSQAIALVTAGLQGPAALGASCSIAGGSTRVTTCTLLDGESATINTGGAIIVDADVAVLLSGDGAKTVLNDGTLAGRPAGIAGTANGTITINNTGTISGSSAFGEFGSQAAGIWLTGDLDAASTLTNDGLIEGFAFLGPIANGVRIDGDLFGAIDNTGTIHALDVSSFAQAIGVGFGNGGIGETGTITNSGAIAATAFGFWNASAVGLGVDDATQGSIDNSGTISATASAFSANANGVWLGAVTATGTVTNSGDITAVADGFDGAEGLDQRAVGLRLGDNAGAIDNTLSGVISASASAYFSTFGSDVFAHATGVLANSNSGTITNSGEISAYAEAITEFDGGAAFATATGLNIDSVADTGSITSDGAILATAVAFGSDGGEAIATGVRIGDLAGGLDNAGTIIASASASFIAIATGVDVGLVSGSLSNSGTIHAGAGANFIAYGIGARVGDVDGTITNTGVIAGSASAEFGALAAGMLVNSIGEGGAISNSGAIFGFASASEQAFGAGLIVNFVGGSITNDGDIVGAAGAFDASATGLSAFAVDGTVTNDGFIGGIANAFDAQATGVSVEALTGTLANSDSISAQASGFSAEATGVSVGFLGGAVTNSGSIFAGADGFEGQATGIRAGLVDGTLTNTATGQIMASADAFLASAVGVDVDNLWGDVDNSGLISAEALGSFANAIGVNIESGEGGIHGSLSNGGTISASADGGEGARAIGILADRIAAEGSIFSDGEIVATATDFGFGFDGAEAVGIEVDNAVDGSLVNAGSIGASASAPFQAHATGIYANATTQTGSLANSGSIEVHATATNGSFGNAFANGIVAGYVGGTVSNAGTISASADGAANASAFGILGGFVDDTGLVSNSGDIGVEASGASFGVATGIRYNEVDGDLVNSGSIDAHGSATSNGGADGIRVGFLSGDVTNSGSIDVSADGDGARAFGIGVSSMSATGSIANTGDIGAEAAGDFLAIGNGINVGGLFGDVDNRGSIDAGASAGVFANALGIFADFVGPTGSVSNSGAIKADAEAGEFADAVGIVARNVAGTVASSGSITATADGGEGAIAVGIDGGFIDVSGTVANSGAIKATATGDNFALASGFWYGTVVGDIDNSGSVTAKATGFDGAEAYGIMANSVAPPGTITNRGDISASAVALDDVQAAGIWSAFVDGTVQNSGTIKANAKGNFSASAYGILVEDFLAPAGTVSNTGSINVVATAVGSSTGEGFAFGGFAWAGGLATDFADGTLENNGSIEVKADGAEGATAFGLGSFELGALGTILNDVDGLIRVTAISSDAIADGIGVLDGAEGAIENRGGITVSASGTSYAAAAGIYVGSTLTSTGSISNSGSISATAVAGAGFDGAEAYGIYVEGEAQGDIDNSGSIDASASASTYAEAFGIFVSSTLGDGASITNSGDISVSAAGGTSAVAGGIVARFVDGTIENSGTIEVGADGGESLAYGIATIGLGEDGSIVNSGGIDVFANTAGTSGEGGLSSGAAGVYVGFMSSGTTITNTGTITADNGSGPGSGWAVWVDGGEGPVTPMVLNSGTLDGNVRLFGASMENSGVVSLPTSTNVFANGSYISGDYTQSGAGVFEIDVQSDSAYGRMFVEGTADLSGSGAFAVNVLPANSLAVGDVLDNVLFADDGLVTGVLSVTDDSLLWNFTAVDDGENGVDLRAAVGVSPSAAVALNGPAWASGAAGALGDVIYGGDADGDFAKVIASLSALKTSAELSDAATQTAPLLAGQSAQAAALSLNSLGSVVTGRMDTHRAGVVSESDRDQNLWARGFGQFGEQDEDSNYPGWDIKGSGIVIGYDQDFGGTWNVGAALAYSETDIKANSALVNHKIEAETYQGALYAYWSGGDSMYIDLMAVFGSSDNDSTRQIAFADVARTAAGSFDTSFLRFSGAFGKGFQVSDNMTFTPVVDISYTTVEDDSYTETGAGDLSLAVDDNDIESLIVGIDGRLGVEVSDTVLFTVHAGVGWDGMTDDTTLSSAFVGGGPAFQTTAPEPEELLIRAGLSAELAPSSNMEFHFNYEYENRDTFENNVVTGTLRWKF